MKAVRFHEFGGPEVLKYEDVDVPIVNQGEVLVKVGLCGVNRFDTRIRAGAMQTYLPHILGTDVTGEIHAVAAGVNKVKVGDRVVVYHILNDGTCDYCLSGEENRCSHSGMIGAYADGGYSEFVRIRSANVLDIGDLDFRMAATLPMNFATAWNGLVSKAGVGPNDVVLIWAAGSGIGCAAVLVAKLFGAKVIATAGSPEKLQRAKEIGADYTIDHYSENVPSAVMSATNNNGATIAFDHLGQNGWGRSIDSLRKGGTLLSVGVTGGPKEEVEVGKVYRKELRVFGIYGCTKGDLRRVITLSQERRLKPVIYREMSLAEAEEAHGLIESGKNFGKILLKP